MDLNEAKQLLSKNGYRLIKENGEIGINLEVVVYDDGYRPSTEEIKDDNAAKEWVDLLNWRKLSDDPFKIKFTINETNINEVLKKISRSSKNHYGFSYLTGYVNGTINGKTIDYEKIAANDIEHDLKQLFQKYGIEIQNEAKQLLKQNGYEGINESHVQGHCAGCGEELWSDEAYLTYGGKRYCEMCYDELDKKSKYKWAIVPYTDITNNKGYRVKINLSDCYLDSYKEVENYAIKKVEEKFKTGVYGEEWKDKFEHRRIIINKHRVEIY